MGTWRGSTSCTQPAIQILLLKRKFLGCCPPILTSHHVSRSFASTIELWLPSCMGPNCANTFKSAQATQSAAALPPSVRSNGFPRLCSSAPVARCRCLENTSGSLCATAPANEQFDIEFYARIHCRFSPVRHKTRITLHLVMTEHSRIQMSETGKRNRYF